MNGKFICMYYNVIRAIFFVMHFHGNSILEVKNYE